MPKLFAPFDENADGRVNRVEEPEEKNDDEDDEESDSEDDDGDGDDCIKAVNHDEITQVIKNNGTNLLDVENLNELGLSNIEATGTNFKKRYNI